MPSYEGGKAVTVKVRGILSPRSFVRSLVGLVFVSSKLLAKINPLILLLCFDTFLTEVVGRSCLGGNRI